MARYSLAQSAADTPLAQWLVGVADRHGWRSGRQAALYLGVRQSAFSTWLRGTHEPDRLHQERLAEAAGVDVGVVADLVWRTKSQKQELTVGDLRRMEKAELPPTGEEHVPGSLDERLRRLEAIDERLDRIERKLAEGLTHPEMQALLEQFFRRYEDGERREEYLDDPDEPDEDGLRRAAG